MPHATPTKDDEQVQRNGYDDCLEPADGGCFYNGKRDQYVQQSLFSLVRHLIFVQWSVTILDI